MRRRHLLPSVILVLTTAACGSDHATHGSTDSVAVDASAGGAALSGAEVEFAQGMIAHHQQAIDMADLALDPARGAGAEVRDLTERIMAAQDPEIDLMTGWLTAAGRPTTFDAAHVHDMPSMEGMMSAEQMTALAAATGDDFDRMWLEMMIAHHRGAIAQSEAVTAKDPNDEVSALAASIIAAQQAEIAEMEALLG